MRPERIIIGECRGPETLDMLQAMNTGHEGSMTTLHANTPRDGVARMENDDHDGRLRVADQSDAAANRQCRRCHHPGPAAYRVVSVGLLTSQRLLVWNRDTVVMQDIYRYVARRN